MYKGESSEGDERQSDLGYNLKVMHDFLMEWKRSMRERG